jgi:hypothetical protein|tara:strand:- start:6 stop:449 length:444 start_codon:yes stop_codon:yes gene_type:complete
MSFLLGPLALAGKITGAATGTDPVRLGMKTAQKHPELAKKIGGKVARSGVKHVEHMGQRVVDSSEDIADISGNIAGGLTTAAGALTATGIGAPIAALALSGAGLAGGVSAGAKAVTEMKEKGTLGLHQSTAEERARMSKATMDELWK